MFKRFLCILPIMFLLGCVAVSPKTETAFSQMQNNVVQIVSITGVGSGVILAQDDTSSYIITCRHVIADKAGKLTDIPVLVLQNIYIDGTTNFAAKKTVSEIIFDSKEFDLALLKTKKIIGHPVIISAKMPKLGQRVYYCGHRGRLSGAIGSGIISRKFFQKKQLMINATPSIFAGCSGGGLFNSDGELIGIAGFVLKDSDNFGLYTSSYTLIEFLSNNKFYKVKTTR